MNHGLEKVWCSGALQLPAEERPMRAQQLRQIMVENDLNAWLRDQLKRIRQIRLKAQE